MKHLLAFVTIVAIAGCAYHSPTLPTPIDPPAPIPASITIRAVTGVGINANQAAIIAQVFDAARNGVPKQTVTFVATDGTIAPNSVAADADGQAQTIVTSGTSTTMVTAMVGTLQASVLVSGLSAPVKPTIPPPSTTPPIDLPLPTIVIYATVATVGVPTFPSASVNLHGLLGTYHWDFGDGATLDNESYAAKHIYTSPGDRTVTVTVRDTLGRSATASASVSVN